MTTCADGDEQMEVEDSDEGSSNAPERKRGFRKGAAAHKHSSRSCCPSSHVLVLACRMKCLGCVKLVLNSSAGSMQAWSDIFRVM